MNPELPHVPTEQPSPGEAGHQPRRYADRMRTALLWFIAMSVIELGLLISAITSIRDLELAERQLGVQKEKFHQYEQNYELTGRTDKIEYYKRLDKLKAAYFVPDMKGAVLRVKLAAAIVVIFGQAVSLTILLFLRKHL